VLLVVSQFVSQKIISPSPASQDPAQQQTNAILKFLPLMIGYFSLNVPSGLTLYWFTNNLLTTAQQVWLKSNVKAPALASTGTIVKPQIADEERVKKPSGKDLGARRSSKPVEVEAEPVAAPSSNSSGKKGGKKGEKFRALKAKEAAKRAARLAGQATAAATGNDPSSAGRAVETAAEAVSGNTAAQTQVKAQIPNAPPAKDNTSKDNGNGNQ
jgi:YidC/Oxa1 family membrane protein insertase